MSEIVYGIISYKRADRQSTLDYLQGVPKERIVLSLNRKEDIEPYQKYADRATIIYGEAHNAAGNRNNILNYLPTGTHLVLMDDDLHCFAHYEPIGKYGAYQAITIAQAERAFEQSFMAAEKLHINVFGLASNTNAMFQSGTIAKHGRYSINGLLGAGMFGIITDRSRFDTKMPVWDDYDFMLSHIKTGKILRDNTMGVETGTFYTAKGGCEEAYASGGKRIALRTLTMRYGDIAMPSKNGGEDGVQLKKDVTRGWKHR